MQWNFDGNAPIYSQLVEQMKLGIVSGEWLPGQRIPAVRELAVEAGVNPNTMQRALQELERQGLLFSLRTSGRFVTEGKDLTVHAGRLHHFDHHIQKLIGGLLCHNGRELNGMLAVLRCSAGHRRILRIVQGAGNDGVEADVHGCVGFCQRAGKGFIQGDFKGKVGCLTGEGHQAYGGDKLPAALLCHMLRCGLGAVEQRQKMHVQLLFILGKGHIGQAGAAADAVVVNIGDHFAAQIPIRIGDDLLGVLIEIGVAVVIGAADGLYAAGDITRGSMISGDAGVGDIERVFTALTQAFNEGCLAGVAAAEYLG